MIGESSTVVRPSSSSPLPSDMTPIVLSPTGVIRMLEALSDFLESFDSDPDFISHLSVSPRDIAGRVILRILFHTSIKISCFLLQISPPLDVVGDNGVQCLLYVDLCGVCWHVLYKFLSARPKVYDFILSNDRCIKHT